MIPSTLKILMCMCHKGKVTWGLLIWDVNSVNWAPYNWTILFYLPVCFGVWDSNLWYMIFWCDIWAPVGWAKSNELLSVYGNFPSSRKVSCRVYRAQDPNVPNHQPMFLSKSPAPSCAALSWPTLKSAHKFRNNLTNYRKINISIVFSQIRLSRQKRW